MNGPPFHPSHFPAISRITHSAATKFSAKAVRCVFLAATFMTALNGGILGAKKHLSFFRLVRAPNMTMYPSDWFGPFRAIASEGARYPLTIYFFFRINFFSFCTSVFSRGYGEFLGVSPSPLCFVANAHNSCRAGSPDRPLWMIGLLSAFAPFISFLITPRRLVPRF